MDDGRSPSDDGSGCEPTASAAISVASSQSRIPNADELPDDWQDHCGDPQCDICPPASGMDNQL
jgi:hypothetical protein